MFYFPILYIYTERDSVPLSIYTYIIYIYVYSIPMFSHEMAGCPSNLRLGTGGGGEQSYRQGLQAGRPRVERRSCVAGLGGVVFHGQEAMEFTMKRWRKGYEKWRKDGEKMGI